jgi:hypothetical protein
LTTDKPLSPLEQLLTRAPAVKRTLAAPVPQYAHDLARLWSALEQGRQVTADEALVARFREILAENERKLQGAGHSALMERLANAIAEPAVAISPRGHTWNESLAALYADAPDPGAAIVRELQPLERLLTMGNVEGLRHFLYPLGERVFSLRLVQLPDEELSLAYFFPTALVAPPVSAEVRFVMCAKLSGLPSKQIAPLAGTTKDRVDFLSRRHQAAFLALKAQFADRKS